jgi:uncharacterized protein with FMN-binding domain
MEEKMKKLSLLLVVALMMFSIVGCSSDKPAAGGETKVLEGTAKGFGGDVKVTVTVNGDDIVEVVAVGENETPGIGSNAIEQIPAKIAEADSTKVDVVAGATLTSNAIIEAVNNALGK